MATKFTANKGVHFADLGIGFTYDEELSRNRSADPATGTDRVYSTDLDAAEAKALKGLGDKVLGEYGIAEAKATKAED